MREWSPGERELIRLVVLFPFPDMPTGPLTPSGRHSLPGAGRKSSEPLDAELVNFRAPPSESAVLSMKRELLISMPAWNSFPIDNMRGGIGWLMERMRV